ncbi:MAG: endonuclease/exonuclease/phosphatase family protein [Clostridia bacterium]|nr:endonuclease/exonuclease/phosphatase family protein [Clostridia bacterium]
MELKIMSYNVLHCENYITKQIDFDAFAQVIRESGADIIGLNEIRGKGIIPGYTAQAKTLAERLGYHYYFARAIMVHGTSPYGNALLSRYPIKSAQTIMIPDPETRNGKHNYETRCILKAEIDVPCGLNVLVTHFGLNPEEQINAVRTVCDNLPSERCVLMGDFNATPDNAVLMPVKERMYDTAQCFDCGKLSFPSDKPEMKIDYIFTSRDISVLCADIPEIILSDHRPYVAKIKIN